MKLEEALRECTLALLRRIATSHGVAFAPETLRAELAGRILHRLLVPGYLAGYLEGLEAEERALLQAAAAYGWVAKAFVLDRRFPHRAGPARRSSIQGPAVSLLQKGLLFRTFAPIGDWRGEIYHVPEELRPLLSEALPPIRPIGETKLEPAVAPVTVDRRDAAQDTFCLLSFLRREEPHLIRGSLSRTDLVRLEQASGQGGGSRADGRCADRWAFLLHLCLAGGWVTRQGSALKPARGAARLLSGGRGQVQTRLLEQYLRDRSWSDLAAAGRVRQPLGSRRIDEAAARRLLLHYLGEMAGSGWVDPAAFCEAIRATNPDLLREDYSSLDWAVVDTATDAEIYGPDSWDIVEGEWIRRVLAGPLAWLGLVQWGRDNQGQLVGFRYLPTGKGDPEPPPAPSAQETAAPISVGVDLEVRVPAGADLEALYRLEPYLEPSDRPGTGRYLLSKASALGGVESGGSWAELASLLRSPAVGPLPHEAVRRLEEWEAAYGRFTLRWGLLLEARTPEDAELLRQGPAIAPHLLARLGPAAYLVSPEQVWDTVQQLKLAGHLPRVAPGTRAGVARAGAADLLVAREALFALLLTRSLYGRLDLENGAQAIRRLEAILGPEESREVARRVQEATRRVR